MIGALYIEREIAEHPRVEEIAARFPKTPKIACERWGEVFNRGAQNFRLQKKRPSLILARKHDGFVLPAPDGYGIGTARNFYFSHMLNCVYDCRYCFLQGMYRSAHQVIFVNYEDFFDAIEEKIRASDEPATFFSGYDCDSLAFEKVTAFAESFLPFFHRNPAAWLELRTKSVNIESLLTREPPERCVTAFSFTPQPLSAALEDGVPSVERRLRAMAKLAERGRLLGLRFDPLLWCENWRELYRGLFEQVFTTLDAASIHSVSLGPFRLPTGFFRRLERLHPEAPLLAGPFETSAGMVSYRRDLERELVGFCSEEILRHIDAEQFFPCALPEAA